MRKGKFQVLDISPLAYDVSIVRLWYDMSQHMRSGEKNSPEVPHPIEASTMRDSGATRLLPHYSYSLAGGVRNNSLLSVLV